MSKLMYKEKALEHTRNSLVSRNVAEMFEHIPIETDIIGIFFLRIVSLKYNGNLNLFYWICL